MKFGSYIIPIILFPLLVVIVLVVFGIPLGLWFYIILVTSCIVAAGIAWLISKETERKINKAVKGKQKITHPTA